MSHEEEKQLPATGSPRAGRGGSISRQRRRDRQREDHPHPKVFRSPLFHGNVEETDPRVRSSLFPSSRHGNGDASRRATAAASAEAAGAGILSRSLHSEDADSEHESEEEGHEQHERGKGGARSSRGPPRRVQYDVPASISYDDDEDEIMVNLERIMSELSQESTARPPPPPSSPLDSSKRMSRRKTAKTHHRSKTLKARGDGDADRAEHEIEVARDGIAEQQEEEEEEEGRSPTTASRKFVRMSVPTEKEEEERRLRRAARSLSPLPRLMMQRAKTVRSSGAGEILGDNGDELDRTVQASGAGDVPDDGKREDVDVSYFPAEEEVTRDVGRMHRAKTIRASGGAGDAPLLGEDEDEREREGVYFPESEVTLDVGMDYGAVEGEGRGEGDEGAPLLEGSRPAKTEEARIADAAHVEYPEAQHALVPGAAGEGGKEGGRQGGDGDGAPPLPTERSHLPLPDVEAGDAYRQYGSVVRQADSGDAQVKDNAAGAAASRPSPKARPSWLVGSRRRPSHENKKPDRRSGKELWFKMRDRINRGSFMVHSFGGESVETDKTERSLRETILSGGGLFGGGDDGGSARDSDHSVRRRLFERVDGRGSDRDAKTFAELDMPYEFTTMECIAAIVLYLLLGIVTYSYVIEAWPWYDSVYFTVITFCTVGFGDLIPSTDVGRIFTCFFAIAGISFLGLVIGVMGSKMVEAEVQAVENANREMLRKVTKIFKFKKRADSYGMSRSLSQESSLSSLGSVHSLSSLGSIQDTRDICEDRKPASEHVLWYKHLAQLVWRYLPALVPMFLGSLVIAAFEGWDVYDAIYFCISTTATIGYGDLVPTRPSMKWFAMIYIPLAVGAMGHTLGTVANFIIEKRREAFQKRLWSHDLKVSDLKAMDWDNDGAVTQLDYVEFMLLTLKKVDPELLHELHEQFEQLDVTHSGTLTKRDLQLLAKKRLRRVRHKLKLSAYKHKLLHSKKKPSEKRAETKGREASC